MSTKQDHLSIEEEAQAFDKDAHAILEVEVVLETGYINEVAQDPYDPL